jgi:Cu(I)/Ag(I) efflux system membrane protein CusA/SilA
VDVVKVSRKFHRWLMLFIGVQFVIWSITGAYMVFFDIDYIHGDSLVVNHQTKIDPENIKYSLTDLYAAYPAAENISLTKFIEQDVYRFKQADKKYLLSAINGKELPSLDEASALKAAKHYYAGDGEVLSLTLINENPPFGVSRLALPAWQINFDNLGSPSIYVSAQTGLLVGKRHEFWYLFDWMFRFHIMDYGEDEDVANQLLFWFAGFGIIACISGLSLTYFRVFKAKKKIRRRG